MIENTLLIVIRGASAEGLIKAYSVRQFMEMLERDYNVLPADLTVEVKPVLKD